MILVECEAQVQAREEPQVGVSCDVLLTLDAG